MKKFTPVGEKIKALREQLVEGSLQKELSYKVGISVRMLRKIENESAAIPMTVLEALATELNVEKHELVYAFDAPQLVSGSLADSVKPIIASFGWDRDQLVPRFDDDIAKVTMDETELLSEANGSEDVVCVTQVTLNEETQAYVSELASIVQGVSWSQRSVLDKLTPEEEREFRKRIRQLLVLLKGNNVWVYETKIFRTLPESNTLQPDDLPSSLHSRLYVVFGAPGEYGEDSVRVTVDHGQPFMLKAWKTSSGPVGIT